MSMEEVLLTKRKLPQYLVGSDYFAGLNDEEEFTLVNKYFKPDPVIDSCEKLLQFLETARFWGVHKFPGEIVQYLEVQNRNYEEVERICLILSNFDNELPLLQAFRFLQTADLPKERSNVIALLRYAFSGQGLLTAALVKTAAENGLDGLLQRISADVLRISDHPFTRVSMATVVRRGHVGSLRFMLKNNCPKEYDICSVAAGVGRLDCLKLFQEFGSKMTENVMCAAARHGQFSCLEYVHSQVGKITVQTAIAAAAGGYLECVKYVLSHDVPFTADVLTSAARHGHADLLPLLQEHGGVVTSSAVSAAASNGHIDCIRYLIAQGAILTSKASYFAAAGGHLECLQLLHAHDCPCDADCITAAASAGHLDCINFLLEAGCPIDDIAAIDAASNGHAHCLSVLLQTLGRGKVPVQCVDSAAKKNNMDCLRLLHGAGVPLDLQRLNDGFRNPNHKDYLERLIEVGYHFFSYTAEAAIRALNFDCLAYLCEEKRVYLTTVVSAAAAEVTTDLRYIKLLHQYNCPWDVTTCASAAACNNLACLTYLHEQGCPWDDTTYIAMMRHVFFAPRPCFIYALANGCPLGGSSTMRSVERFLQSAAIPFSIVITNAEVSFGSVSGLKNVLTKGAPMNASTCAAAASYYPGQPSRSLVMLNYLRSQNCPWDERTSNAAAAHPTVECLQFVHERGCPWSSNTTFSAASARATQCLQYLIQHNCPYDEAMERAAAQPTSECLEVLHRAGCCWSVSVACAAANAGSLACLQYARQHKCPWDVTVSEAATQHPECLHYCVQEGCPIMQSTMEEYSKKYQV